MTDNQDARQRPDHVWKDPELAKLFLQGIRGGVPFAAEQLDMMFRVLDAAETPVRRFLDLGCGDGFLGQALLVRYPETHGTFLDLSPTMLEAARDKLGDNLARVSIVEGDFGTGSWVDKIASEMPFDVVVSGFAIHHQPDNRKRQIYREIFDVLAPGGMFLHHEHVSARSHWAEAAFVRLMVDSLWQFHNQHGGTKTRAEIEQQFVQRKDWSANILAPLEDQCAWLREIGYCDVDCFFKAFEVTLFGGRKPLAC